MRTQSLIALAPLLCGVSAGPAGPPGSPAGPPAGPPGPPGPGPSKPCKPLPVSSETTCGGIKYLNRGLVAYGSVASDARDKVGDTLGGFGSSITVDDKSFKLGKDGFVTGTMFASPDRGWNTNGTIDYQGRIHQFKLSFKPTFGSIEEGGENLNLDLKKTMLLFKDNKPTTGLDATAIIPADGSFPDLPAAERPNGDIASSVDIEGLALLHDGSFWISDETGPFIYHFSAEGEMIGAIEPPMSFLPYRDGEKSFSSGNPPNGSPLEALEQPDTGRTNNRGFEGLTISPDERYLTVQIQQGIIQDGGDHSTRRNKTRQLTYDLHHPHQPQLISEYAIEQPAVDDPTEEKNPRATSCSEIHWLAKHQILMLNRDSGHGNGGDGGPSTFRGLDIVDYKGATNIRDQEEAGPGAVAVSPNGYLLPNIKTMEYCSFININNDTDLARFDLRNDGDAGSRLLNEKWESIAIVPVPEGAIGYGRQEYYIIAVSDNDYITQDGYYNFGKTPYSDTSGGSVDSQVLVWQAHLPEYQTMI